eukprot:scaffold82221_cov66-Phaeocystis_antarctica.AAC.2
MPSVPHREPPTHTSVTVVRERADEEIFAGRRGCPFGGGSVVGESVRAAIVPLAVAVRGDLCPRAEVRIARVDLDVLREQAMAVGFSVPARVTNLPVATAPGVRVVKREDEVDVVVAVHTISVVREEVRGAGGGDACLCQIRNARSLITVHNLLPASDAGMVVLAVDIVLPGPLPVHERRARELELKELHHEPPAPVGVPVVREGADLKVFARTVGRPFGGGTVVGERVDGSPLVVDVVPLAVAVRGDLRPRTKVRIARVDLNVLRESPRAIAVG